MISRQQATAGTMKRIDGDQHEADAVDAGPWRELIDERVVHLRVAKLIPWNAGDAGGGELKGAQRNGAAASARRVEPVARRTSTTPSPKSPK